MQQLLDLPPDVRRWLRQVLSRANQSASRMLTLFPETYEVALDHILTATAMTAAANRMQFASGWNAAIDCEFVGGTRQHNGREVADVAVALLVMDKGFAVTRKLVLLQSKRLFHNTQFAEGLPLWQPFTHQFPLPLPDAIRNKFRRRTYHFDEDSIYRYLRIGDPQNQAIQVFEEAIGVPIYYLFYNPFVLPWTITHPDDLTTPLPRRRVGCRVVKASALQQKLGGQLDHRPSFREVSRCEPHDPLEHFMSGGVVDCTEGYIYPDIPGPIDPAGWLRPIFPEGYPSINFVGVTLGTPGSDIDTAEK